MKTVGLTAAVSLVASLFVGLGVPAEAARTSRERAQVVKVTAGDAVVVRLSSGRRRSVSMIGINAPDITRPAECGAREARGNLRRLLPRGQRVTLVSDPTQRNKDRDGRLLRYVEKPNGKDINRAQLRAGWARLHIAKKPFKRVQAYRAARTAARQAQRGAWDLCSPATPPVAPNVASRPDDTGVVAGGARALAAAGDRTILGGRFTRFGGLRRSNVAAVRPDGTADPGFVANTDGAVEAVATSDDGSTVFLGGTFTRVNGVPRANLAAVDATTGAVLTDWSADTGGAAPAVLSLAVHGDRLYVAGRFTAVDGARRARIVAVGTASGDVDAAFRARANGPVREIVVSPGGETVYAGGGFTRLSGEARAAGAGAVLASDGSATPFDPRVGRTSGVVALALSPDGARLLLTTQNNFVRAYDPGTGNDPMWNVRTSGNIQAVAASGTEVYLGGHFARFPSLGVERPFLASVRLSDGLLTSWDTKCSGPRMGVWDLLIQGSKLHAAGVFRFFRNDPQRGYARFSGAPTP